MTIASMDDVVAALASSQMRPGFFPSVTTVAGRLTDLNAAGAGRWGQMAMPAANSAGGTLHAAGDVGFPWMGSPGGGNELHLMLADAVMQTAGSLLLYERIWSCSGFVGNSASAQNVTGFPTLTIPDSVGTELELFAEIYAQIGTTATTLTASYTNSANTSGRTTVATAIGGTGLREVYRLIPIPLQGADAGVKSIVSVTLAATTGTAGNWGLVLARKLGTLNSPAGFSPCVNDFAKTGCRKVSTQAAIMHALLASTTTSGIVDTSLLIGEN